MRRKENVKQGERRYIKRKITILAFVTVLALSLASCSGQKADTGKGGQTAMDSGMEVGEMEGRADNAPGQGDVSDRNKKTESAQIPDELVQIPEDYFTPAREQGTVERMLYQTYESMGYESREKQLDKTAYVYLPYGYSKDRKYNVFYLMHGGWSDETTYLGTPENPNVLVNVIDHAIQDGKMGAVIVVCPTYNNENPDDSADYSLALRLTDNYHNELVNDLLPAVEGTYSTYAEGTSAEELEASRNHRAFAGFSSQIEAMLHAPGGIFTAAETESEGNLAYRVQEGNSHDGEAAMQYIYNGLIWIWK